MAVNAVIPDMSVALAEFCDGAVVPDTIVEHFPRNGDAGIKPETVEWIKSSNTLFYAFHWYGTPSDPQQAMDNALALGDHWDLPTFLTEVAMIFDFFLSYLFVWFSFFFVFNFLFFLLFLSFMI